MANAEHVHRLRESTVDDWKKFRANNHDLQIYLSGADLSGANLAGANLSRANLSNADLRVASLRLAKLSGAILSGASRYETRLFGADLGGAGFIGANLIKADLVQTNLVKASLFGANLNEADLSEAVLVRVRTGCFVYCTSVWDVHLEETIQSSLVVTPIYFPAITVDSLEVGQFIYLVLNNKNIRRVIDTITSKVVLILGRFKPERKSILDGIRDELRKREYLPVLFDFEKPANHDITEIIWPGSLLPI